MVQARRSAVQTGAASADRSQDAALTVDHIAHFVPDIGAAGAALQRLGFEVTPFSQQVHRLAPGGPLVPAGTANRCVMLARGYLEILTPTAQTALAEQLRAQMARYHGVHLVAFGTSAPDADHARLATAGFDPLPPVALERPIDTPQAEATARFTVVRVPPPAMPEGRIQFCQHHTPELLWQSRWTSHANGALALTGVVVCVADPAEAARRYSRFTGLAVRQRGGAWALETARGWVVLVSPAALASRLGIAAAPAVPWIAGYTLAFSDLAAAAARAAEAGCEPLPIADDRVAVALPPALGGFAVFERPDCAPLDFPEARP